MKKIKTIVLMGIFSTLFSCNQSNKETNLKDIVVVYDDEDSFKDIDLSIISEEKTKDKNIYIAKGLYKGKTVGLKFEINTKLPKGLTENGLDKNGFIKNALQIKSIGNESDEFLKAISETYGFPDYKNFKNSISVPTLFSLNKENVDLNKNGEYRFKLFFEEDSAENYCEIFFNISTDKKIIGLHEKDEEYRKSLIKVFTN
ncbi:hypothetical protein [Flavobacterium flavigenum]|uniref:hypothetical protein n=1 Tax=Flavobacterium flavigenum TaxID=3003258 RepID=UPI002482D94A|nr:hypothetical protein [Flavobacterium flavigenum]